MCKAVNKILIIGSNSVLGRSAGEVLKKTHLVFYAGRKNADYYLDLHGNDLSAFDDVSFDVVLHFASDFGGDSYEDFARCFRVNVAGTLLVCHLAEKVKAKHLIIISSVSALYKTTFPLSSAYSLSKKQADDLAILYTTKNKMPLTIIRPSQVYDTASLCQKHQPLFYHIVKKASHGENITFYGQNNAIRNYLHIQDLTECILRTVKLQITGVYCCTHAKSVRLCTIANTAYEVFKTSGEIIFDSSKESILDLPVFSGYDFYKKIGYFPKITLKKGLTAIKEFQESLCLES